jgi:hypothetical protein
MTLRMRVLKEIFGAEPNLEYENHRRYVFLRKTFTSKVIIRLE